MYLYVYYQPINLIFMIFFVTDIVDCEKIIFLTKRKIWTVHLQAIF